jgi:hypothetical protein
MLAEFERRNRKPATSAWDHLARGIASQWRCSRASNAEAMVLVRKAIEFDRNFATAYALASNCSLGKSFGWATPPSTAGRNWPRAKSAR